MIPLKVNDILDSTAGNQSLCRKLEGQSGKKVKMIILVAYLTLNPLGKNTLEFL